MCNKLHHSLTSLSLHLCLALSFFFFLFSFLNATQALESKAKLNFVKKGYKSIIDYHSNPQIHEKLD
jgi:hypothetical protein